jgi:hypothetical protein
LCLEEKVIEAPPIESAKVGMKISPLLFITNLAEQRERGEDGEGTRWPDRVMSQKSRKQLLVQQRTKYYLYFIVVFHWIEGMNHIDLTIDGMKYYNTASLKIYER